MVSNIPDGEHVARYCGHQKIVTSSAGPSVTPAAFELREQASEKYLSVNHCEHHTGTRLDQLRLILGNLTTKGFTWRASGALAVLDAAEVRRCGEDRSTPLRVRRRHHEQDPSYASIDGMPLNNSDLELLDMLAAAANAEVHLVSNIP